MKQKTALLAIDVQNDFMDIPGATLGVTGATKDVERLNTFIDRINPDKILASQDSHYRLAIHLTSWWRDAKGNVPAHSTTITANDVKSGKYYAIIDPTRSLRYVEELEAKGNFTLMLWPDHCIMGTVGHNFYPPFLETVQKWMDKKKTWANYITKGVNPYTEHFGIFEAEVPIQEDMANTGVNQGIFNILNNFETIYLVGQAKSHCVLNSLRQILSLAPQLASKLIVLEDCMSNVPGLPGDFYDFVDGVYNDAKSKGVQIVKSTDI